MQTENLGKKDVSISFWSTNIYAIIIGLPIFIIFYFLYFLIWGKLEIPYKFPYWLIYLIGVVIHELIHGLFAIKFRKQGIKSINFGISWKLITPYCHCKEALFVKDYRIVVLAPLIILGVIPGIVGLVIGLSFIYSFGIIFILAAGGDLLIIWKIRNESRNSLALDCSDKCGCEIYETEELSKE